ncbi:Myosin type-2 heavy chain 1 [Coemansia sp. RSA 1804]|nr:Myosin type-2 heavy chain 1 [Coemansia sp. RSA 1804]
MPFSIADARTTARALKILEHYTKGAKAWFEDTEDAWTKATLAQRTQDDQLGICRLLFVKEDSGISTTAKLVAQTSPPKSQPAELHAGSAGSATTAKSARSRRMSVRAASPDEFKRIAARGSRLTGGRISSMERVDDSYVIDVVFSELVEPNADAELLPPLCNPPILDCTPDLTTLSYLHEPAVVYNLKRRYEQKQIYTYSGVVLVAMNPFHPMPLYTAEYMARYAKAQSTANDPHLFAIAENAYKGMVNNERNQTIIVYGESGSGKTTSAKYIMRYFAQAHHADTNDKQMTTVESQILATNPVFESFGNAKTTRNDNSSRFGKFLDIKFERRHQKIVGGRIRTFLLERSRVAYQPPTERNYHIFYQLLAGASDELRAKVKIDGDYSSWRAFHYTRQGGEDSGTIQGVNDAEDFAVTDASLGMVGIDSSQRNDIWRTLAGILHLGNVVFSGTESVGSYVDTASETQFVAAAELLGVGEAKLRQWLTKRQIVTRHDHILAKVNKTQALVIRDSIAKFIYSRLFDWILGPINSSLLPTEVDESLTSFVGVLDIYGFEHFEHNSFEQFCINYANEKLQQNFNHHVFKLEQEEYRREQLQNWTFIGFQDNQPCIDLIEGKPIGILSLLDEESRLEQGSDRTFTEKLYRQFDSTAAGAGGGNGLVKKRSNSSSDPQGVDISSYFRKPRFSNTAFTVRHYAHDVTYEGDGFLEKNKDTVPDEILDLLCSSSFDFQSSRDQSSNSPKAPAVIAGADLVSGRSSPVVRGSSPAFGTSTRGFGARGSPNVSSSAGGGAFQRRQAPTLAGVFKRSLAGLMSTLAETEMHYVRCIKPNEAKAAWQFEQAMVISQLRSCGVIETIRISKAGYPSRVPIRTFNSRYAVLLSSSGSTTNTPVGGRLAPGETVDLPPTEEEHALCNLILQTCLPDQAQYQVGLTKVFFRAGQWAIMEKKRSHLFENSAVVIQKHFRGALVRTSYRQMVAAAKRIQRWYRSHLFSRRIDLLRRRCAVEVIERGWIEYCEAKRQREYNACSRVIQALVRGSVARVRFKRMREAKLHADAVRIKEEAEALRREADAERMRAEKARKDAENERARASAQAARAKAQAMAQNLKQLEQEQQRQLHPQQQQQQQQRQRQLQHPSDSASRHNNGAGHANGIRETPAQYTAQSDDNDSLRTGIVPPALRTDSNAVNEAFARLTMSTSPTSPTGPNTPISYPDIRRISTYSNEAARQHAAEARASLLAAGVAERNAEAELARSNSSNNYSAYSPTVFSSSPRNTYGYRDGFGNQQQQQSLYMRQQQQQPPVGSDGGSSHIKSDSLTIGDDIYAIINEFSVVADGRYGEVDARSLKRRELGSTPSISHNHHGMPSPSGSSSRLGRSPGQSTSHINYQYQTRSGNRSGTQSPGIVARDVGEGEVDTAWIQAALRTSGDGAHDEATFASQLGQRANGNGPIDSNIPARYKPYAVNGSGGAGHNQLSKRQSVLQRPPGTSRNGSPAPYYITNVGASPARAKEGSRNDGNDNDEYVRVAGMASVVYKRESHTNMSVNSTKTSLTDVGGRHTAARARAWAARQKDRMLHAFSGDRMQRRSQTPSSYRPPGASKLSAEMPKFVASHESLEPPTHFKFHHQTQSATNVAVPMQQPFERPLSSGSTH